MSVDSCRYTGTRGSVYAHMKVGNRLYNQSIATTTLRLPNRSPIPGEHRATSICTCWAVECLLHHSPTVTRLCFRSELTEGLSVGVVCRQALDCTVYPCQTSLGNGVTTITPCTDSMADVFTEDERGRGCVAADDRYCGQRTRARGGAGAGMSRPQGGCDAALQLGACKDTDAHIRSPARSVSRDVSYSDIGRQTIAKHAAAHLTWKFGAGTRAADSETATRSAAADSRARRGPRVRRR